MSDLAKALKDFLEITKAKEKLIKNRQDKEFAGNLHKALSEKGVNKPFAPGPGAAGISGQGYTVRGAMATISPEGNRGQAFRQPKGGPNYDRGLARDKAKNILTELKGMPKPNLPKTEKAMTSPKSPGSGAPKMTSPQAPNMANTGNIPKITSPKPPTMGNSAGIQRIQTVKTQKSEPLTKPWESKAQARWGHSEAGKRALGGEAAVHEWDKATHGKKLPEKLHKPSSPDDSDPGKDINTIRLSEDGGNSEQLYHIHEGKMRITSKPQSLKDITAKHGPVQQIEGAGFRLIPEPPKPASPGKILRRSE